MSSRGIVPIMDYLNDLNSEQRRAVEHTEGPLLIVAGAGTGKTKTLTYRVLHLIRKGVDPGAILAITFTNKAAKEMRERIEKLLANDVLASRATSPLERPWHMPFIGTFHALCVHILRNESALLNLPRHFSIFDRNDSISAMREALRNAGFDPKQYEPGKLLGAISRQKGEGTTRAEFDRTSGEQHFFEQVMSSVWKEYEHILTREKALDFDDLLLSTVELLKRQPDVLARYHAIWRYVHVDEYQDTNKVQYDLSRLLAGEKTPNICVVGDGDQCLPPNTAIKTPSGEKRVSTIKEGDNLVASSGHGETCVATVQKVHKRQYAGSMLTIKTKGGRVLHVTPNHIVFGSLSPTTTVHYVYLMYQQEHGFRVGIVQGSRSSKKGGMEIGPLVRSNQEKADRMWILKVCSTKQEARYWESFLAFSYGIPTLVFHALGRKILFDQRLIDQLYKNIDTGGRVKKLFLDTGLCFEYPHHYPQGSLQSDTRHGRINIRLTLFSDNRKSTLHPWGLSRVSINTADRTLKKKLLDDGFSVRKGKREGWRFEAARLDYGKAERLVNQLASIGKNLTVVRSALLTKNKRFLLQPAANMRPTMRIAVHDNGQIVDDEVVEVTKENYDGIVYDLDISSVHNYIANDIIVHNCIYGWRGADMNNILFFERDYPGAQTVVLEENYRSTAQILAAANGIIAKNSLRKEKTLFTKNRDGEKIALFGGYNEADEARFVTDTVRTLAAAGTPLREIAILYRTNFQSRVLEEAFIGADIAHQVLGVRFFDRKEVKDVLSFLRAALNPESFSDIKRVINIPPRGIGKVTLLKMFAGKEAGLPKKVAEKIADFRLLLARLREVALSQKPSEALGYVIKETGMQKLLEEGDEDERERFENLKELVSLSVKYDAMAPGEGMEKLLEDAALASDQDSLLRDENAVKLTTVHAAKGLEFDCVFVTGLEQDLFPHHQRTTSGTPEEREEERRLFYVAVTRARKKLFLTYAFSRMIFGMRGESMPSEFIMDIDPELLEETAGRYGTPEKIMYLE